MSDEHWERIYRTNNPTQLSWYQPEPGLSLDLTRRVAPDLDAPIINVGGGASTLVDGCSPRGIGTLRCSTFPRPRWHGPASALGPGRAS
jgi:hypothetical protein